MRQVSVLGECAQLDENGAMAWSHFVRADGILKRARIEAKALAGAPPAEPR
jgi:hypothetical protein